MNSLSIVVFCVAVACASASLHGLGLAGHGGAVLAGPSGTVTRAGAAGPAAVVGPAGIAGHGIWGGAGIVGAPGIIGAGGLGINGLGLGLGGLGGLGLGHAGLGLGLGHAGLLAPGSGLEGQWVPDINEHLYDDGSYKPHIYGH